MKSKIYKLVVIIVILCLLPLFMGQDECNLGDTFKNEVVHKIDKAGGAAGPVQVNVSFYPRFDRSNQSPAGIMTGFNYLMAVALGRIAEIYNGSKVKFHFQRKNRTWDTVLEFDIDDNIKYTKKITDVLFDSRLTRSDQKIKTIEKLIRGSKSDILMTARCYEDLTGDVVTIEMAALFRNHKKIKTKRVVLPKDQLYQALTAFKTRRLIDKDEIAAKFFKGAGRGGKDNVSEKIWDEMVFAVWSFFLEGDGTQDNRKSPDDVKVTYESKTGTGDTKSGDELQINETVKALMENINKKHPLPPASRGKLYITNLSFMDAVTQSTMVDTRLAALIDKAVIKGMNEARKGVGNLAINQTGHLTPNTGANVNRLVNVVFDPNLTKTQKIDKIIDELMNLHSVDVIVTGHYIDEAKNPMISIRPLVIIKSGRKIVTRNLQFTGKELICKDPGSLKLTLCRGAREQIVRAVRELLEQL